MRTGSPAASAPSGGKRKGTGRGAGHKTESLGTVQVPRLSIT